MPTSIKNKIKNLRKLYSSLLFNISRKERSNNAKIKELHNKYAGKRESVN